MDRRTPYFCWTFAMVFGLFAVASRESLADHSLKKNLKVGVHQVQIERGEHPLSYFKITYDQFESWKYLEWGARRWRKREQIDPDQWLGDRSFWLTDPQDTSGLVRWMYPEMAANRVFEATLTTASTEQWDKLWAADEAVLAAIEDDLFAFMREHWKSLAALEKQASGPGNALKAGSFEWQIALRRHSAILRTLDHLEGIRNSLFSFDESVSKFIKNADVLPPISKTHYSSQVFSAKLLLVVHSTSSVGNDIHQTKNKRVGWDSECLTRPATEALVRQFKASSLPVVYLMHDDHLQDSSWCLSDRSPDLALYSKDGEHSVMSAASELVITGGKFGYCHGNALRDAISRHFLVSREPLTIDLPMDAIYTEQNELLASKHRREGDLDFISYFDELHFGKDGILVSDDVYGPLNLTDYDFKVSLKGKQVLSYGYGLRQVHLRFVTAGLEPRGKN
ncbi:MAG: hypothetical protein AB1540_01590 [Bdellovibrionota bacterium]